MNVMSVSVLSEFKIIEVVIELLLNIEILERSLSLDKSFIIYIFPSFVDVRLVVVFANRWNEWCFDSLAFQVAPREAMEPWVVYYVDGAVY